MSLLSKAKEELLAEKTKRENAEEEQRVQVLLAKKASDEDRKDWYLRLQALLEEEGILVKEGVNCLASLEYGKRTLGYFFRISYSESEYVSDYGYSIYNHYDYILFTSSHYSHRDDSGYFQVDYKVDKSDTIKKIGEEMVKFYKTQSFL